MSDKITLPGQLQHSNPQFSIVDVNDIRGGIKSVDVFDSNSLDNLHSDGPDKFLMDYTLILERSSNSFFWMSGVTSSDINSWTPISIEQDNKFKYYRASILVGGRGILTPVEEQIEQRVQQYFDTNTIEVSDSELVIFLFSITEYGAFLTHERKYTFPDMLGKGTYNIANNNAIQFSDLELIYKGGDGTTNEDILTGSVNNIIIDLGDITGEELVNYLNTNGDLYDLSDMTKIYYFKFTSDSIEYIYYFEGDDSINGYGLYGLGEFQFDELDLTLFYSSSAPVISPVFSQDNRFRFVEFKVTLKGKKYEQPTITNTTQLLKTQVNNLFASRNLTVYETELIIFKFYIIDTRVNGMYIWKYFFKNMQGKGLYSPIYPTIKFEDLEVAHQDLSYILVDPDGVSEDVNNVIFDFGDVSLDSTFDNFLSDIDSSINNYLEFSAAISIDMSLSTLIYFFKFIRDGVEYLYYYSGEIYGLYGLSGLDFISGDILLFYNSSTYNNIPLSLNNNIPKTYSILSTDIDKPLLEITEEDVSNYINSINGPVVVDEYDSLMIFDVYQPQIDIQFSDINYTGILDVNDRYQWNDFLNNSFTINSFKTYSNKAFSFSDVSVYGNTVSLIGDLNDIEVVRLLSYYQSYSFSSISFGSSKLKQLYINSLYDLELSISNLKELEYLEVDTSNIPSLSIESPNLTTLVLLGNVGSFNIVEQGATDSIFQYSFNTNDLLSESDLENLLYKLVQSDPGNIGIFTMNDFTDLSLNVNSSSYVLTLESRGWIFEDPLELPPPPTTTTTAPPI